MLMQQKHKDKSPAAYVAAKLVAACNKKTK